jgi:hypothetical protein
MLTSRACNLTLGSAVYIDDGCQLYLVNTSFHQNGGPATVEFQQQHRLSWSVPQCYDLNVHNSAKYSGR